MRERALASMDSGQWFAAQVRAGREQLSVQHLRSRGYDILLPLYHARHRWSDRVKTIQRALFPGYLFCRVDGDVFGKLLTAPGVIRLVGDGRQPLPIPAHEIDAIRRLVESGVNAERWPYVCAGERVRIVAGPLRDTEGIVLRTTNINRLVVSITLLQRSLTVELDASWVTVPAADLLAIARAS